MHKNYIKAQKVNSNKRGGYKPKQQKTEDKIYDWINNRYHDDIERYRCGRSSDV